MPSKGAPDHWPPRQLPLASDSSQGWHVGKEAGENQQGCGTWGLMHSRKTPQACGTEDGAGRQLRGRKLKGKAPLRSSANHALFCSNSSEKVEKSTMLEGPVPGMGRAQVRIPALWTQSSHSSWLAPVLSSVKWVRLQ